jgi:hypothetical protein
LQVLVQPPFDDVRQACFDIPWALLQSHGSTAAVATFLPTSFRICSYSLLFQLEVHTAVTQRHTSRCLFKAWILVHLQVLVQPPFDDVRQACFYIPWTPL